MLKMDTLKTRPCILTCIGLLLTSADLSCMTLCLLFDWKCTWNPQPDSVNLCAILLPDSMVCVCKAKPVPSEHLTFI